MRLILDIFGTSPVAVLTYERYSGSKKAQTYSQAWFGMKGGVHWTYGSFPNSVKEFSARWVSFGIT